MNFECISHDDYAKKAADSFIGKEASWGLTRALRDAGVRLNKSIKEASQFHFIGERTVYDPSVKIMSDVWASESYREVLGFDRTTPDATKLNADGTRRRVGLVWVRDGYLLHDSCAAPQDSYCFHSPNPALDHVTYEGLIDWIDTEAGDEEAEHIADREARAFEAAALKIERDREVVVVRGRKVAKGTKGVVFWLGDSVYGGVKYWKVGIRTSERKDPKTGKWADVVFTALNNVDLVYNPTALAEQKQQRFEEVRATASKRIKDGWRALLEEYGVFDSSARNALVA